MKLRILLVVTFSLAAFGLARADTIIAKGREKAIVATVSNEDAKGITVVPAKLKKVEEFIPAADIIDIFYDDVRPVDLILGGPYKGARESEKEADSGDALKRKNALAKAITQYADTHARMMPHKYAKRMIEFKIATLTLRQALNDGVPTDKAIAKLQAYKTAHPTSWQILQVVPLIAQTQMDAKDFKGAAITFQEMADMEGLPMETRINAELEVVRVHVRDNDLKQAQTRLDALAKKAAGNAQFASRVKMTRAELLVGQKNMKEAVPILQQVIKENNDKQIKAIAHNTLGECYFKDNRHSEAMWEFLWVDAVFNQDKQQHAKALYYLWKTFEQLNNAERAQECREMLLNDRQFTGTEFQVKGAKEAK